MGGHSSSDRWPFYRSIVTWFLPWVLIAAVVATGVWFAVDAVSDESFEEPPAAASSESAEPSPTITPTRASPTPTATLTPTPSGSPAELITEGVSVQVLNGSMIAGSEQEIVDELTGLGFHIAAVQDASQRYEVTTVFWSAPEWEEAAVALAAHFGWEVAEKPPNLSDEVSVHVVVGVDEAG